MKKTLADEDHDEEGEEVDAPDDLNHKQELALVGKTGVTEKLVWKVIMEKQQTKKF